MVRKQEEDEQLKREAASLLKEKEAIKKAKKGIKPPSASNNKRGQKVVVEDDDDGDTFLTDVLRGTRAKSSASSTKKKVPQTGKITEQDFEDNDSDEYQDVVYDYE